MSDARGAKAGAILWECKNAKNWSPTWIEKLKEDQRALRADIAVLVTTALPKGCARFMLLDGVLVTDFASAAPVGGIVRSHLLQLAWGQVLNSHVFHHLPRLTAAA